MTLSSLIDRLLEIQNSTSQPNFDPEVSIMTEEMTEINGFKQEVQYQRIATDIGFSNRSGVVIIGQEL